MAETKEAGIKSQGIKKIFYFLLILGLILGLSGGVSGYNMNGGGICECGSNTSWDACVDCNSALDDAQCTTVFLNRSIADYNETCIYDYGNFNNKVFDCQGNTISGNGSGDGMGIYLLEQSGNTIKNCVITGFDYGIYLHSSQDNTIANNTVNSNTQGIYLYVSAGNNLTGNSVNLNMYGIYLESLSIVIPSSNNVMRNNAMSNNTYNFNMDGYDVSDYYQDIDASNTVDDKPIYYWIGNYSAEIPHDAGFVGLISCDNITVKDLNLSKNFYGILLVNTVNSKIINNTVHSNEMGIYLENSQENNLMNNTMTGNTYNFNVLGSDVSHYIQDIDTSNTVEGKPVYYWTNNYNAKIPSDAGFVGIVSCGNITVENLNLSKNSHGILLVNTTNSSLFNNTVNLNIFGIYLDSSKDNKMRKDTMFNNSYNFNVIGSEVSYYRQDVDTSNRVNENPIYYLIGNSSSEIPSGAGFVALISCDNMTIENLNISNNFQGILLVDTINSKILNNTLDSNVNGIYLDSSRNNLIADNIIDSNSDKGIYLRYSSGNNLTNNTVINSCYGDGIYFTFSAQNTASENTIQGNLISGIYVDKSDGGNRIYNNTMSESTYGIYIEDSDGGMTDNAKNRSYEWYPCDTNNAGVYVKDNDVSLGYSLTMGFNYFGRNITSISASTNGFIELLETGETCYDPGLGYGCNRTMHSDGTYKSNTDIIFGFSDFLQTGYLETQYLAICNMPDKVIVEWNGSTGFDYESEIYTINFQVVLYKNGTIQWNFKEMNWNTSNPDNYIYDMFSGLYAKEENLEVTAGKAINTQGSYYYIRNLSSAVRMGEVTENNVTNNRYGIYLNSSSHNVLLENTILNNSVGIYSENSISTVNSNFVCYNTELDFNSTSWLSTSGDNNTCDNADGWNDTGAIGCTDSCPQPCYCNSCEDCTNKLNNNSCPYVILNESIINHNGTCIYNPENFSSKVFDCGGHKIGGNGNAGYNGIYLNEKSGNTIKDCVITEFGVGISLDSSSNNDIINNEITDNSDGIYLFYSDNNKILNNKILNNNQTGITLSNCGWFVCPDGMYCDPTPIPCALENINNTIEWNEISNNRIGIYSENSISTVNSNYVCGNAESDFNSTNWLSSTGDNNTCDNPGIWSDNGGEGCSFSCYFHRCDLNHDGIYVNDYNDLMTAYKCFLGVEKECEKIGFGNWKDIKREYLCFVNN